MDLLSLWVYVWRDQKHQSPALLPRAVAAIATSQSSNGFASTRSSRLTISYLWTKKTFAMGTEPITAAGDTFVRVGTHLEQGLKMIHWF
jgi:hypothetical protein